MKFTNKNEKSNHNNNNGNDYQIQSKSSNIKSKQNKNKFKQNSLNNNQFLNKNKKVQSKIINVPILHNNQNKRQIQQIVILSSSENSIISYSQQEKSKSIQKKRQYRQHKQHKQKQQFQSQRGMQFKEKYKNKNQMKQKKQSFLNKLIKKSYQQQKLQKEKEKETLNTKLNNQEKLIQQSKFQIQKQPNQQQNKKQSNNPITTSITHNNFNIKRLVKQHYPNIATQQPFNQIQKQEAPILIQNIQPQLQTQKTSALRNLYTYNREGSQSIFYTSFLNIREKINQSVKLQNQKQKQKKESAIQIISSSDDDNQINVSIEKTTKKSKQKQKQKQKQKDIKASAEQQKKINRFPRYFEEKKNPGDPGYISQQDDNTVKCFRCKQYGHIARSCPQQVIKQKCLFCLQQHHFSQCTDSRCFKCGQKNHVAQKCDKRGIKCRKCGKIGHIEQHCDFLVFLDYHDKDQKFINQRYSKSQLKKLKCLLGDACKKGRKGHFNCFEYSKKRPMPYQKQKLSQKSQKGQWTNNRNEKQYQYFRDNFYDKKDNFNNFNNKKNNYTNSPQKNYNNKNYERRERSFRK